MQIKIDNFEGPLDLLLQLIEKEELDITQISLLKVTEQYMAYLDQIKGDKPDRLADFLLVAAKLLYIKSKALLPEFMEEEEEGIDLAEQLRMYKKFVEAGQYIGEMFYSAAHAYGRPQLKIKFNYIYQPPKSLTVHKLYEEYKFILKNLKAFKILPRKTIQRVISIKEKINHILRLLNRRERLLFSELANQAKDKTETVVSFLGLLELTKQRRVIICQQELFGEIIIKKAE